MNKVHMIGRLTDYPEQRQTPSGVSVCTFSIAVRRRLSRDIIDYFNVVTWRGLAETCAKYLVKGQQIAVIGELQTRRFDDKNNIKRYITEVVAEEIEFLAKPNSEKQSAFAAQAGMSDLSGTDLLNDEDLPFN